MKRDYSRSNSVVDIHGVGHSCRGVMTNDQKAYLVHEFCKETVDRYQMMSSEDVVDAFWEFVKELRTK